MVLVPHIYQKYWLDLREWRKIILPKLDYRGGCKGKLLFRVSEWKDKGYIEFLTDEPLVCEEPELIQVFTKPSELTGVIYELIKRDSQGFCEKNTKRLMESTKTYKHRDVRDESNHLGFDDGGEG